jgi:ribosomal protein S18 acetylase RimI-like enzyme
MQEPLARVRAAFVERGRQPRFEFIEQFAPALALELRRAGYVEEGRQQFMVCSRNSFKPAGEVPGLTIATVTATSPQQQVQDFVTVQRQGFDPADGAEASVEEAERFRSTLQHGLAFLGRLDGLPVTAAMITEPQDALTEVVGIATREPFRRRGMASAVTAAALLAAFSQGVEIVCLTAADERAGRIYEHIGFRPVATTLSYRLEREA